MIFSKLGIERNFLHMVKGIYDKYTADIILNCGILSAFPLSLGISRGIKSHHFFSTLS